MPTKVDQSEQTGVKVIPSQISAAVMAVRDFYPCAWGSESSPISEGEARALVRRIFDAAGFVGSSGTSDRS